MSDGVGRPPAVVVVATPVTLVAARDTVRTALAHGHGAVLVVDLGCSYPPVGAERVLSLGALAVELGLEIETTRAAATVEPDDLVVHAGVLGATLALQEGAAGAVVLGAGIHVVDDLGPVLDGKAGLVVAPVDEPAGLARRAAAAPVAVSQAGSSGLVRMVASSQPLYHRGFLAVAHRLDADVLLGVTGDWRVAPSALDAVAVAIGARSLRDGPVLLVPWRSIGPSAVVGGHLMAGDTVIRAVDLSRFDPHRPGVLDAQAGVSPRVQLSQHPVLRELLAAASADRLADEASYPGAVAGPELGWPGMLDPVLRDEARRSAGTTAEPPDVLGLGVGVNLTTWALELVPAGHPRPVARYLRAVRSARPDLQHRFRDVPGTDSAALARWGARRGAADRSLDGDLLEAAVSTTKAALAATRDPTGPRVPGVDLVGYLAGELGLGVSARLVDDALRAAGVDTSTVDVSGELVSRRGATWRRSADVLHDTTILCVNAPETVGVAQRLGEDRLGDRVIAMWYWELEEFPDTWDEAFAHVDEVWAATDFVRDAISTRSGDVPVRTVMPPLPQASGEPGEVPEHLGLPPGRPYLLFTFDFLSAAARKNPEGLIAAFDLAFGDWPVDERPLLVIKTINAASHPVDADRLRALVAGRGEIVFLDAYLPDHERHVLVAHCAAYVSLHRAEGLGLTVAEAMAWGRPVITTAYGGVTQFCNEDNSFLVGWRPSLVEETTGPYRAGMRWAEPDLEQAAAFLRLVVDDPARAASVGARAAHDIRTRHNAEVAGRHMHDVLDEGRAAASLDAGRVVPQAATSLRGRWAAARVARRTGG